MTKRRLVLSLAAFAAAALCSGAANSQQPPQAAPQSIADAYRGMFVCEKVAGSADILHVPLDLVVRGEDVQFARPLFNLRGTRVVGSELGDGKIESDGKVHLTSTWNVRGITVRGDYSGTLTPNGGTLTGTQSWRGPDGDDRSRTCQVALAPAPRKAAMR